MRAERSLPDFSNGYACAGHVRVDLTRTNGEGAVAAATSGDPANFHGTEPDVFHHLSDLIVPPPGSRAWQWPSKGRKRASGHRGAPRFRAYYWRRFSVLRTVAQEALANCLDRLVSPAAFSRHQ